MTVNTWPTLSLEVAFGYGPFDASPVWTAIPAADFVSATWTEGRQKGLEDFPPAQAQVVLRNDLRQYDPEYAAGAHFGDLNPRTPVRFTATRSSIDYKQFTLFVEGGWEQGFAPPAVGYCTLQLIDLLGVLQGLPFPGSPYDIDVLADDPAVYWQFDETQGDNVMHDSSGFERHGQWGEVRLGADGLVADGGTSAEFEHQGDYRGLYPYGSPIIASYPSSFECWFFVRPDTTIFQGIATAATRSGGWTWRLSIPHASYLGYGNTHGGLLIETPFASLLTTATMTFGLHHLVWRSSIASDIDIWIDGVEQATTIKASPGSASDPWSNVNLASISVGNLPNTLAGDFGISGYMDNVAIYPSALADARIVSHYTTGRLGWYGDTTGVRAGRVLDVIGVPALYQSLDAGSTVLGAAVLTGDALSYLSDLARTEQGGLYTAGYDGGKIRFESRYWRFTATRSTTSQATFTDDPAVPNGVRYERGSLLVDPNGMSSIINAASVSYVGGTEVVTVDSPYGPRGTSISTLAPNAAIARSLGEWVVALYSEPATRVRGLTIAPDGDTNAWVPALGLRIGDRVTLRRNPLNVGSAVTSDFWIEGRTVTVENGRSWKVAYNLQPVVDPGWWIWDVSEWDDSTRWAY